MEHVELIFDIIYLFYGFIVCKRGEKCMIDRNLTWRKLRKLPLLIDGEKAIARIYTFLEKIIYKYKKC
jgi:hypothetical protein